MGNTLAQPSTQRKEGLAWLERARRLNPALARIDFEIGKTQFALTDFQSATSTFDDGLRRRTAGNGEAAFFLAESWAKLGDWEKARDSYADALARGYTNGLCILRTGKIAQWNWGSLKLRCSHSDARSSEQPSLDESAFPACKSIPPTRTHEGSPR